MDQKIVDALKTLGFEPKTVDSYAEHNYHR
jgi:hypothetical protein